MKKLQLLFCGHRLLIHKNAFKSSLPGNFIWEIEIHISKINVRINVSMNVRMNVRMCKKYLEDVFINGR